MVDFGRELDGSEGIHCIEDSPYTDYAKLTYPHQGEYLISKRRYSAFFGTDLEILLKGLHVDTLYLIGGLTDVCIHYTAVDAHQHDYHIKVVTDAVAVPARNPSLCVKSNPVFARNALSLFRT